jgi:hypothetical protein
MRRPDLLLFLCLPCWIACNGYGSPQSLATTGNRLGGVELVGRWHCPADDENCDGDTNEVDWLEVRRRDAGLEIVWKRAAHRDSFVGYDALDRRLHVDLPRDTTSAVFSGDLLRIGPDTILELTAALPQQSLETVPVIPIYTWVRVHVQGDSLSLEALDGERLVRRLEQQPGDMRPFRILRSDRSDAAPDVIAVALGNRADVERFVRRAFADPALVQQARAVLVRGPVRHQVDAATASR